MPKFDFSTLQIMVIEDNLYMRRLIAGMLEVIGVEQLLLRSGIKDAKLALRIYAPDILLLDRQLRDGDGLHLLRHLRSSIDRVRASIPVVMLTAHGDEASVIAARDCGATSFLVKPVSAETLVRRIAWIVDPVAVERGASQGDVVGSTHVA